MKRLFQKHTFENLTVDITVTASEGGGDLMVASRGLDGTDPGWTMHVTGLSCWSLLDFAKVAGTMIGMDNIVGVTTYDMLRQCGMEMMPDHPYAKGK